jgi:hypothetical protein
MMKGQDVVVALKLASGASSEWTFAKLADATGLSPSQALASVGRLRLAGLVAEKSWRVSAAELADFLVHGLPYVFPTRPGGETVGVPTGSALRSIQADLGLASSQALVWPYAGGSIRGGAVEPLHRSVPRIALGDQHLHELLALVDCVRLGRPRERALAASALRRRINR